MNPTNLHHNLRKYHLTPPLIFYLAQSMILHIPFTLFHHKLTQIYSISQVIYNNVLLLEQSEQQVDT